MDLKSLNRAIEQIAQEKGIAPEVVLEAVESSIAAAYRKEYAKKGEIIKAKMNPKTGELNFWQAKIVVDQNTVRLKETTALEEKTDGAGKAVSKKKKTEIEEEEKIPFYNPDRHIFIEEARKIKPDIKVDDELTLPLEEHQDFGRIAAQAAKQVILQKIREAEKESVKQEYSGREGEIISGIVQRIERGNVYIDLGRAVGVMFDNETIPGEYYRVGERLKFYLLAVQEEERAPGLVLSRSHPDFISKLFTMEVPEIQEGLVEIKAVAREAGNRTKIAVSSKSENVDPIGSLVGQRGTRVMAVTNELGDEKIDIIEWSEDPAKFITAALSPAKAQSVEILPRREAKVFVDDRQLSLAIGKGGQNVRLAAKLTGWKIDVRSYSHPDETHAQGVVETEVETEDSAKPETENTNEITDSGKSDLPNIN